MNDDRNVRRGPCGGWHYVTRTRNVCGDKVCRVTVAPPATDPPKPRRLQPLGTFSPSPEHVVTVQQSTALLTFGAMCLSCSCGWSLTASLNDDPHAVAEQVAAHA